MIQLSDETDDLPASQSNAALPVSVEFLDLPSPPRQNWLSANGIELVEPLFEPSTWPLHIPLWQGADDVEPLGSRRQLELQPVWKLG